MRSHPRPAREPEDVTRAAPAAPAMQQVLWSESLEGRGMVFARLHGVDLAHERAWISISNTNQLPQQPDLFQELVELDFARGEVVQRWRENVGGADEARRQEFGLAWPLADGPADIARLADIAAQTGTHSGVWGAPVVVSPDGGIAIHHRWGDDKLAGDWLIMRDRDGNHPVRLDRGFTAAYAPVFSPEGTQIAFTACKSRRGRGCGYGVYVHTVGGKTEQVGGLGHANQIVWSPDGEYLYAIDTNGQVPFISRWRQGDDAAERVFEDDAIRDLSFAFAPSGNRAVFAGMSGEPGTQTAVYRWVSLPDAVEQARYELYLGTGLEAMRDDGVALVRDQVGLVAVDPFRGRQGKLAGLYQGADASAWDPEGRILLGHPSFAANGQGRFELVRVNPEAMLVDDLYVN